MTATRPLAVARGYLAFLAADGHAGIEAPTDDDHLPRTRISLQIFSVPDEESSRLSVRKLRS